MAKENKKQVATIDIENGNLSLNITDQASVAGLFGASDGSWTAGSKIAFTGGLLAITLVDYVKDCYASGEELDPIFLKSHFTAAVTRCVAENLDESLIREGLAETLERLAEEEENKVITLFKDKNGTLALSGNGKGIRSYIDDLKDPLASEKASLKILAQAIVMVAMSTVSKGRSKEDAVMDAVSSVPAAVNDFFGDIVVDLFTGEKAEDILGAMPEGGKASKPVLS